MAGKKSLGGVTYLALGSLFGLILDFIWQTNAVAGHNTPMQGCNALTIGDAFQIGGISGLNVIANVAGSGTFSAITSGMILGNLTPKLMTMMGKPRYIIYDLGAGGSVNPILRK